MKYHYLMLVLLIAILASSCETAEEPVVDENRQAADAYVAELTREPAIGCTDCETFTYVVDKEHTSTYVAVEAKEGAVHEALIAQGS